VKILENFEKGTYKR